MASHLTITTATAGTATTRNFSAAAGSGVGEGTPDSFGALLGATAKPADPTPAPSATGLAAAATFDGEGASDADPEALAALLDALPVTDIPAPAVPLLSDLTAELSALQASLAAGEPLDTETLERLDASLAALAKSLGIALNASPDLAVAAASPADDAGFAARLAAALAPLAETLLSAPPPLDAQQAAALKAVSDKLASLLAGLAPPGTPEPLLAEPELKLTEPVLTGKPAARTDMAATDADPAPPPDTEAAPKTPAIAAPTGKADDGEAASRTDERKPTGPGPAAAALDKQPELPASTQPAPAARADIVAAPRVVQVGYQTSQQQLNLPQIAFELVRQVSNGNSRFQIRLDPPELGKIDVRLDIDAAGKVHARLTVEKAETLDLMQRDQRGLERALQQAGLDGARSSLEFSLRQNPFSGGQQGQGGSKGQALFGGEAPTEAEEAPPPTIQLYRGRLGASGLNIIA